MTKKVSVIIPVYNVKDYVEDCLNSIISQNYENLEVIVTDDGSIDGSGEICDAVAQKDPRIRVIHTANQGFLRRETGVSRKLPGISLRLSIRMI